MKNPRRTAWLGGQGVVLLVCGCSTLPDPAMSPKQYLRATMRPFETQPYVELSGEIQGSVETGPFYLLMGPAGQFVYRGGPWSLRSDGTTTWQLVDGAWHTSADFPAGGAALFAAVFYSQGPLHLAVARPWVNSDAWESVLIRPGAVYEKTVSPGGRVDILIKEGGEEFSLGFVAGRPSGWQARTFDIAGEHRVGWSIESLSFPQRMPAEAFRPTGSAVTQPVPCNPGPQ